MSNLKSSQEIQDEINNKRAAIEQEKLNGQQANHEQINQCENEISILEMQLADKKAEEAQQEHAQVQQQAQAAQIGGLKEIIRSIRDAVYLKELMDRALGITENATATQDFNSMVDQAVDEDQTALYAAFNTQLEQRDERFRLLTLQALEVQKQLDASVIDNQHIIVLNRQLTESNLSLSQDVDAFEKTLNDYDEKLRQCEEEIQRLKDREFELQQQIANVKPKSQIIDITPTAPSESLSERIAQATVNSKLQLANVKSIGGNWVEGINEEGNKEVAHITQVEHVTEFPSLPSIEVPAEPVPTFPEDHQVSSENSETDTSGDRNEAVHEGVEQNTAAEETLTLESLKAEIDALKTAHDTTALTVARIAEKANLPIAV